MNALLTFLLNPFSGREYTITTPRSKNEVIEQFQYVFARSSLFSTLPYVAGKMVSIDTFKIISGHGWLGNEFQSLSMVVFEGKIKDGVNSKTIIYIKAYPDVFMKLFLLTVYIGFPLLAIIMCNAAILFIPLVTVPIIFSIAFYIRKILVRSVKDILLLDIEKHEAN